MSQFGMLKRFCIVWGVYWFIYLVQPVHSIYDGIVEAFLLQAFFVFVTAAFYCLGVSRTLTYSAKHLSSLRIQDPQYVKFMIMLGIILSAIGLIFLLYDKISVQGIDYSQGLAIARQEWRVLGEERSNTTSSMFSAFGYIFGGAYFLSLALSVSRSSPLSDRIRFTFIFICLAMLLLNSAITGGRSSILLAMLFISFGYFSSRKSGNSTLFRAGIYNKIFTILLTLSALYALYIFYLRALASGQFVGIYSLYFLDYLGLAPYESFVKIAYETGWGGALALVNLAASYLTHSITTTAAILDAPGQPGDVLFVNFMQIGSKFGVIDPPQEWFLAGRFASLPGALYLQYGAVGLIFAAALLGIASGALAKEHTAQPGQPLTFFLCSVCELILLMSPFLFAAEFLFFPSIVIGAILVILLTKVIRE